jgi:hypothetical protein
MGLTRKRGIPGGGRKKGGKIKIKRQRQNINFDNWV